MSIIDQVLKANEDYAELFDSGQLATTPAKKLAILTCMDARIRIWDAFGLKPGDAHIIRNAGGIMTGDAIRSLIISHHLLGTREFMVVNHTDCGMVTFNDEDLRERLHRETGTMVAGPATFHAFRDTAENVRRQIEKARSHPWIPREIPIRGFIYDVRTGRLQEVASVRGAA